MFTDLFGRCVLPHLPQFRSTANLLSGARCGLDWGCFAPLSKCDQCAISGASGTSRTKSIVSFDVPKSAPFASSHPSLGCLLDHQDLKAEYNKAT
jgi:hypothetical protein